MLRSSSTTLVAGSPISIDNAAEPHPLLSMKNLPPMTAFPAL
jgi:hypothetical protein